jgi:hypothetical protein
VAVLRQPPVALRAAGVAHDTPHAHSTSAQHPPYSPRAATVWPRFTVPCCPLYCLSQVALPLPLTPPASSSAPPLQRTCCAVRLRCAVPPVPALQDEHTVLRQHTGLRPRPPVSAPADPPSPNPFRHPLPRPWSRPPTPQQCLELVAAPSVHAGVCSCTAAAAAAATTARTHPLRRSRRPAGAVPGLPPPTPSPPPPAGYRGPWSRLSAQRWPMGGVKRPQRWVRSPE